MTDVGCQDSSDDPDEGSKSEPTPHLFLGYHMTDKIPRQFEKTHTSHSIPFVAA
jgi:hypothetical protein